MDGIKLRGKHLGRRMDFFKAAQMPAIVVFITILCIARNTFPRTFTILQFGVSFREECQQCVQAILAELRICFSFTMCLLKKKDQLEFIILKLPFKVWITDHTYGSNRQFNQFFHSDMWVSV